MQTHPTANFIGQLNDAVSFQEMLIFRKNLGWIRFRQTAMLSIKVKIRFNGRVRGYYLFQTYAVYTLFPPKCTTEMLMFWKLYLVLTLPHHFDANGSVKVSQSRTTFSVLKIHWMTSNLAPAPCCWKRDLVEPMLFSPDLLSGSNRLQFHLVALVAKLDT